MPVPQTDTGRRGEYPKALERTLVKELGKLDPVTSGEGVAPVGFIARGGRSETRSATV